MLDAVTPSDVADGRAGAMGRERNEGDRRDGGTTASHETPFCQRSIRLLSKRQAARHVPSEPRADDHAAGFAEKRVERFSVATIKFEMGKTDPR